MEEDKLDVGIVTPSGIWFDGNIYSCSWAVRHQWFKHAEFIGGWLVSVRSHKEQAWLDEGHLFETCILLEREERYLNKRVEEVEDLLEIERYQGRHQEVNNMLSKIELDAQTKAIVDEATKKTDAAIQQSEESNSKRVKGIRQRRSNEKASNREQEAFQLSEKVPTPNSSTNNVVPLKSDDKAETKQAYVPPADKLSKIKAYLLEDGDDE